MYSLPSFLILLLASSITRGQFLYNYEQEQSIDPPETDSYDPSQYNYNPPQAVEQRFIQPRQNAQVVQRTESASRRSESQPKPAVEEYRSERRRNLRTEQPSPQPVLISEEQRNYELPQQIDNQPPRRTTRRRYYRVRENFQEMTKPPIVYSPSVFENVGLGQAPQGVYIPENSLLNTLRSQTRQVTTDQRSPHMNSVRPFIQPEVRGEPNSSPFFSQSQPLQQQYQQSQPTPQSSVQPPPQQHRVQSPEQAYQPTSQELQQNKEFIRQRTPSRVEYVQQQQPQSHVSQQPRRQRTTEPAPPAYDTDFQDGQPARRPSNRRAQEIPQQTRRFQSFQAEQSRPIVYSPSVFENVALGQAPQGIYVPEDSLLNILRSETPRSNRAREAIPVQRASQQTPDNSNSLQQSVQTTPRQTYHPSSQELQHNKEFVRQRRPSRVENVYQQPQVQATQSPGRQRQRSHVQRQNAPPPQTVYETPAEPINNEDSGQEFQDYQPARRSSNRRAQEIPQQRQRPKVRSETTAPETRQRKSFKSANLAIAELPNDEDGDGIPGQAGTDYPTLHVIPKTAFSCSQQQHNGYYADLETSCQVMHLCQSGGVQSSFLCPNGTIFSQEKFSCQWWYKVNCAESPRYYSINDNLYKIPAKVSNTREEK